MSLLEAMNLEYGWSKRWLGASFALAVPAYVCLVCAALLAGPSTKWIAFGAFLLQLMGTFSRARSAAHYSLGESVRRPAMAETGLGVSVSAVEVATIAAKYGIVFKGEPIRSEKYYESAGAPGRRRLVEIVLESAFWTGQLSAKMATLLKRVLFAVSIILGVSVLVVLQSGLTAIQGQALAKIYMISLTVWCTGDLWALWRKYDSLSVALQKLLGKCEAELSREQVGEEALLLFGEYNCCLSGAAVIPDFIYKQSRARLNEAWADRNTRKAAVSGMVS